MTGIKICGMTNIEDAINAARCGADALGFIFYPKSPRYISPEAVRDITDKLPRDICKVGVFVNDDAAVINQIVELCGLDLIQLHGDESPGYCLQFPESKVIKAITEKTAHLTDYPVRAILVDACHPELFGGTGKKSDWNFAVGVKKHRPLILSGGLSPGNISEALRVVSPDAVDINSGVELSPGKKDPEKVKKIIDIVRKEGSITKNTVFEIERFT